MRNKHGAAVLAFTIVAFQILSVFAEPAYYEKDDYVRKDVSSQLAVNTADVTLHIDESVVKREINNHMLGVSYSVMDMVGSPLSDGGGLELSEEYKAFAQSMFKLPLARWGGTEANYIHPLKNIGPTNQRESSYFLKDYYHENKREKIAMPAVRCGPVEFIKSVLAINPDAEFIFTISMDVATPEENADFISFLLDKKEASSWGALRASYGLPEPIRLHSIELGNEMDLEGDTPTWNWVDVPQLEWYCTTARKNIDAIKARYPDVKFMGCGKSTPDASDPAGWETWDKKVAEAIGKDMEYYAFHLYHGGYHLAYTQWWLDGTTANLKSVLGEDYKVKIYVTEHATWPEALADGTLDFARGNKVLSLYAALDNAQFFNRMYNRDDVFGANYHNWSGDGMSWSFIKKMDGKWVPTAICAIAAFYNAHLGDRIVPVQYESDNVIADQSSTASKFTAIATPKGEHEVTLILNNMSPDTTIHVTFDFKNTYTLVKESQFTAPNMDSFISSVNTADLFNPIETERNTPNFKSYHMPAKSTVALTLETDAHLPKFGETGSGSVSDETSYSGTDAFSDIAYCWAKNEINLLSGKKLLEGSGEGLFEPDRKVTRAEAAKIMTLALGEEPKEYCSLFTDVGSGDWYAPYVQTMYSNGFMFGKSKMLFAPYEGVSYEELAVLCVRIYSALRPDVQIAGDAGYLKNFAYADDIAPWARSAMAFCVQSGQFRRLYENGRLIPTELVSRADIAYVLYRLINSNG